ncbi:MAG: ABC transporter ATP-binding protein, partial [Candidatus Marinamargulisbacteria bacterium]
AKEVKILGLSEVLLSRYTSFATQFYREDKQLAIQKSIWGYLLAQLSTATFYGGYIFLAMSAAMGSISLGLLTLYLAAFRQGQSGFQQALTSLGSMYENNLYMANLFDFLNIQTRQATPVHNPPTVHFKERGIRFDAVGFRYQGASTWALRGVSLMIPAGQKLALVGHNGAGKSTFIKLICGLYTPTEGTIYLDGVRLDDWDPITLTDRLGIVFQDFNKYQFSVKENVGLGYVPHMKNDAAIQTAIHHGGATHMMDQLTHGADTQLGRWFDNGEELSGGQWQKIALSRGFMRHHADILILDEPTAALDAQAEEDVFKRFTTLTDGKTSIIISHRFPTVRMADRILVIDQGQVIEDGSHDDLVHNDGVYAHLFKLQAKGYA